MKPVFLFLAAAFLLPRTRVAAQSFSLADAPSLSYSSSAVYTDEKGPHMRRMCITHIAGLSSMGVGLIAMSIGGSLINVPIDGGNGSTKEQTSFNDGIALIAGGFILFVGGAGMAIGGGIHDRRMRRIHHWSVIAPKKNQFGMAYNF